MGDAAFATHPPHQVTLVSARRSAPRGTAPTDEQLWDAIAAAWPGAGPRPVACPMALDRAVNAELAATDSVVLLIGDETADDEQLFRLVDSLWGHAGAGVLLFATVDERVRRLGGRGVMVMPMDTPPGVIAATLCALAERQPAVSGLLAELRIARRFQGGLRGEMDRINDEMQLAASVQRELLPRTLPCVPNVDFHVLFRPCGYVSGDIYDVQVLDEHHVGFFIADAVGHGVPAALMTMLLARSLSVRETGPGGGFFSPSEVLERLNMDLIQRHSDVPRFATAVYGVVDCRDRTVTIAGAGHPRPLRIRPTSIQTVETDGGLLGVFPEDRFDQVSFRLEADEMLVMFSDGFETAFPEPGLDDHGRKVPNRRFVESFERMATTWRERGAAAAVSGLAHSLDEQSGSLHQIDDLTLLTLVPAADRPLDRLFMASGLQGRSGGAPKPAPQ